MNEPLLYKAFQTHTSYLRIFILAICLKMVFIFFKYAKNDLCDNLWNFVNYANLVTNCLYISNITIELSIWMIFAIQCNLHKKFINPRWLTNRTKSRFTTISGRSRHLIVTTGLTSWQRLVSTSERWWIFRDDFEWFVEKLMHLQFNIMAHFAI